MGTNALTKASTLKYHRRDIRMAEEHIGDGCHSGRKGNRQGFAVFASLSEDVTRTLDFC